MKIATCFYLLAVGAVCPTTVNATCVTRELVDGLVGQTLTLRGCSNHTRVFYLNDDEGTCYVRSDERSWLYQRDQLVTITSIVDTKPYSSSTACPSVKLVYQSDFLGSQELLVMSSRDTGVSAEALDRVLTTAFVLTEGSPFQPYAINLQTETVHSRLCNHLPSVGVTFSDTPPASFRKCGSCFPSTVSVPDLDIELRLGKIAAQEYRSLTRVVSDPLLALRVESAGERVLSGWPFRLRGYEYTFTVIDDDVPNAFAAPGGKVFVSTGMVDILESDQELDAVLAHEIAHVEFRHGLRQLRSAQKGRLAGAIASVVAGVAVGLAADDAGTGLLAAGITSEAAELMAGLALSGYSRSFELEADQVASMYLLHDIGEPGAEPLTSVLEKVAYLQNDVPSFDAAAAFQSHPPFVERVMSLEAGSVLLMDPPIVFIGVDGEDRQLARLSIMAVHEEKRRWYSTADRRDMTRYSLTCYGNVSSEIALRDPSEFKHIAVETDQQRWDFDNKQDTLLIPGTESGVVLYCESSSPFPVDRSFTLSMKFGRVKRCLRE